MSREIKFRLRDRHNKIIGYEKWYKGSWNREEGCYTANPCWLYSVTGKQWNPERLLGRNKDQFIGLFDKNDKEIYEGDVVTWGYENAEVKFGTLIEDPDESRGRTGWIVDDCFVDSRCEVIGNIYENPELLTT